MSDKPEALRLADALELCWGDKRIDEAAAELRRLHEKCEALTADTIKEMDRITEIHRLRAINAELVEALRGWMNQPEDVATYDACMARAEAALAKVKASNGS